MSTRGLMGVVIDAEVKATYNHSDSYPSWLGERMKEALVGKNMDELREQARAIELVDESGTPTPEQTERLMPFANTGVGSQALDDWYVLTRELQGDLDATLRAGVMVDGAEFASDSLFCEWGYLANLDTEVLEIYRGFNKAGNVKGRFAEAVIRPEHRTENYDPISLVAEVPFSELGDFDMSAYEEKVYEDE